MWTSNGDGAFTNVFSLNTVYIPGAQDIAGGSVTLTLTSNPVGPCYSVSVSEVITIDPAVVVNAGLDQQICLIPNATVYLNGTISGGASTGTWSVSPSNGGTFGNANNLQTTFTPSFGGTITLTLTSANPTGPCNSESDELILSVNLEPVVSAQTASICSDVALNLNLDNLITGSGDTYTYTVSSSNQSVVPAGPNRTTASASNITDVYTNTTGSPVTITYSITPIGSNGCSGNPFTYTVTVNPEPVGISGVYTICSDLPITIQLNDQDVSNGMTGITYAWGAVPNNNVSGEGSGTGNIVQTLTNTTTGNQDVIYSIIPTSSLGCAGDTFTYTITVNPVFSSSSSLTICQGTTTQFYGQTLSTSGTYSHTLQAVNGCDSIVTLNLTVLSSSITLSSSIVQGNISCQGDTSGFIQLTVFGGTPLYTYLWSNGATTEDLINLPAGSYSVLITDANGCSITNQSFITEPTSALSINGNQTNIGCFGGNNGSISINAQGGTPSYDYLWNNGQTTSSINGLSTGTYTVLVTDILNCSTTMTFTIVQPLGEMGLTSTVINPSCLNTSTGSIDISVLNGTPAYNYSWSNGETTEDINNLSSGNYSVTVTDALGCIINTTLTVEDPVNPLIVTPTVNNLNCYGGSDAFINLAISGGISPYDILWNNGETLSMIDSLSAGNYSVMVSDNQGCQIPLSFTISQPAPIVANFNPSATSGCSPLTVTFNNSSSGSYTNYLWNFGNGSTSSTENATITFTQPSCYNISLIISNAAGCTDTLSADSLVCVFAGPDASFVTSSGGIDFYTGQLALQNTSNGAISDYHWSFGDGSPNSSLENPIHYYPEEQVGTYLVILSVIDTNGCVDTTSYVFSLVENLSVYVPNTITINDDNINEVFLPVFSNVDILQSYKLEIFDRWGEMIWETDNVSKGWNGRYKENKNVQIGTYTWKILYKDNVSVSRVMVGHVNVIR
ncbi:MAG: PKD domain-containing protein [Crocinitomicaceae bacterium]|nr:PKD domain-containing protein [Crocinitomicaceae bacterium]